MNADTNQPEDKITGINSISNSKKSKEFVLDFFLSQDIKEKKDIDIRKLTNFLVQEINSSSPSEYKEMLCVFESALDLHYQSFLSKFLISFFEDSKITIFKEYSDYVAKKNINEWKNLEDPNSLPNSILINFQETFDFFMDLIYKYYGYVRNFPTFLSKEFLKENDIIYDAMLDHYFFYQAFLNKEGKYKIKAIENLSKRRKLFLFNSFELFMCRENKKGSYKKLDLSILNGHPSFEGYETSTINYAFSIAKEKYLALFYMFSYFNPEVSEKLREDNKIAVTKEQVYSNVNFLIHSLLGSFPFKFENYFNALLKDFFVKKVIEMKDKDRELFKKELLNENSSNKIMFNSMTNQKRRTEAALALEKEGILKDFVLYLDDIEMGKAEQLNWDLGLITIGDIDEDNDSVYEELKEQTGLNGYEIVSLINENIHSILERYSSESHKFLFIDINREECQKIMELSRI